MPSPKIDTVIEKFVELRDKRTELKREFETADFKLKQAQEKIEGFLLQKLNADKVESFKTAAGTAYISNETRVSCADWPSFYQWVIANQRPDVFEKRLTNKVIIEYEEETGALPPYVNKMVERVVRVRRT